MPVALFDSLEYLWPKTWASVTLPDFGCHNFVLWIVNLFIFWGTLFLGCSWFLGFNFKVYAIEGWVCKVSPRATPYFLSCFAPVGLHQKQTYEKSKSTKNGSSGSFLQIQWSNPTWILFEGEHQAAQVFLLVQESRPRSHTHIIRFYWSNPFFAFWWSWGSLSQWSEDTGHPRPVSASAAG